MKDRRMYFALFDKCFKFDKFGCYKLRDTTEERNTSKKEKEERQDVLLKKDRSYNSYKTYK